MYRVSLIQKKRRTKNKLPFPIYVKYYFNRETSPVLIPTHIAVFEEEWNVKNQVVKSNCTGYKDLNAKIELVQSRVNKIVSKALLAEEVPTPAYVKERYEELMNPNEEEPQEEEGPDFFGQLEEFINSKKGQVSEDVIKDYYALKKHLTNLQERMGKEIRFNELDFGFYKEFEEYLKFHAPLRDGSKGLKLNTVGKQIKNLKVFLNDRMQRRCIDRVDMNGWKVSKEEVDTVYLNEEEIDAIEQVELKPGSEQDIVRDLFIISCETGLRFIDVVNLKRSYLSGDILRVTPRKTRKRLAVPVSPRFKRILEKYPEELPNFDVRYNYVYNQVIRDVCALAEIDQEEVMIEYRANQRHETVQPKYQFISSHTGRRSFCTNQFKRGMPSLLIRRISGHRTEKAFLSYIKIDEEEAAEMMLERWRNVESV